jgi:hypothetical protein
MGQALEELERPKAKDRQAAAGPKDGPGKKSGSEKFTEPLGDTRDKVGQAIGMSGVPRARARRARQMTATNKDYQWCTSRAGA